MQRKESNKIQNNTSLFNQKILTFPLSHEPMEVIVSRNQDGTFKRAEVVISKLKNSFNDLNDFLGTMTLLNPDDRYNVIIKRPDQVGIYKVVEIQRDNDRPEFEDQLVIELRPDQIAELKCKIGNCVTEFFEMFTDFLEMNAMSRPDPLTPKRGSTELGVVLRASMNAKIRFLEEIINLYLAFNSQTYFDVIAHTAMTGAYTLSSLFSLTNLYYSTYRKLRGAMLLKGALRGSSLANNGRMRGEIHTTDGLLVPYQNSMRIRVRRPVIGMKYTPIELESTEDECCSSQTDVSSSSSLREEDARRIAYQKIQATRFLMYGGDQFREELLEKLCDLVQGEADLAERIQSARLMPTKVLRSLLLILNETVLSKCFSEIDSHLYTPNTSSILRKFEDVDGYSGGETGNLVRRWLPSILGLCDDRDNAGGESLYAKLTALDDDILTPLQEAINALLAIIDSK